MAEVKDFQAFKFWCQKVLPLVYDDSLSYYETLCKVVAYLNEITSGMGGAMGEISNNTASINELRADLDFITAELERVRNGEYGSFYLKSLENWINRNLGEIIGRLAKFIVFGLTNDGYFCAYIPDTIDNVQFDTIVDPDSQLYGHLIMKW